MIDKALQAYLAPLIPSVRVMFSRVTPDPDTALFIIPYGGARPDTQFNYAYPSFQVLSRALLADDAAKHSALVFSLLQNIKNITILGLEILEITALQHYYQLKIDDRNRIVYVQNFQAHIYEATMYRS